MKNKKTIITIIVLALVWFLGQRFFGTAPETMPDTSNDQTQVETVETAEAPIDEAGMIEAEVDVIVTEEQGIDEEIDELDGYDF